MDTMTMTDGAGMTDEQLIIALYAYSRGVQDARGGTVPGLSEIFSLWGLANREQDETPDLTWDRFLDTPEAQVYIALANGGM